MRPLLKVSTARAVLFFMKTKRCTRTAFVFVFHWQPVAFQPRYQNMAIRVTVKL